MSYQLRLRRSIGNPQPHAQDIGEGLLHIGKVNPLTNVGHICHVISFTRPPSRLIFSVKGQQRERTRLHQNHVQPCLACDQVLPLLWLEAWRNWLMWADCTFQLGHRCPDRAWRIMLIFLNIMLCQQCSSTQYLC